jgi:DNA-binding HxlR family transcriptional regulator
MVANDEPERRSYQQFCGVARALDLVGERWTLLVVRNLLLGPRRYSDLLAELPGLTTNLLAKRLKDLEAAGLVERRDAGTGVVTYALTERGLALDPVINELGRWGGALMDKPRRGDLVDLALGLLSLRRRYAGGLSFTVGLTAGERAFTLFLSPAKMIVQDEPAQRPALTLVGDEPTMRALFFQRADAAALRASGALTVTGTDADWRGFRAAFGLVESAAG